MLDLLPPQQVCKKVILFKSVLNLKCKLTAKCALIDFSSLIIVLFAFSSPLSTTSALDLFYMHVR